MLANPDFRRFWLSSVLTNFGAQVTMLALPICAVLLLHATPAEMGTLAALQSLPFLLLALPTGVLLDGSARRPDRRAREVRRHRVGIAPARTGHRRRPGAIAGRPACDPVQRGRLHRLDLEPAPRSVREPQPAPPQTHPVQEIREGLAFVWSQPLLRTLAWTSSFWHLLFYGYMALHVLFATRVLGMSPGVMGAAQMVGGLGVLASAMMVKPLSDRYGSGATIVIGLCGTALGFALLPAIPAALFGSAATTAAAYAAVVFWLDCGAMLFFMPYAALRQRLTSDPMLGRMVATMRCITIAAAPLGALAAGALAERFSVRTGLACVAAGALALAVATVFGTRLRAVKD